MNDLTTILPQSGELSKTGWDLPARMTEKQWGEAGIALSRVEGALMWWIGDWWAFGEHKFGDKRATVDSEEWEGPAYQTCKGAGWVCEKFEMVRRRTILPFSFHKEVCALPDDEADALLDWCEKLNGSGKLPTRNQLREEVRRVKAFLAQGWNKSQLDRKALLESGATVVASQRAADNGLPIDNALIAWADQQGLLQPIDRHSEWGNPFVMPGDGTRDEVCDYYAKHYLPYKKSLHGKLAGLKGKLLVCWCSPERCHGDHLAELANKK